jgi:hypothetical protein
VSERATAPKREPYSPGRERDATFEAAHPGEAPRLTGLVTNAGRPSLPTPTYLLGRTFAIESDSGRLPRIQAKLKVSQPGDPFEEEADRIAERIVGSSETPSFATSGSREASRESVDDEEEATGEKPLDPGRAPPQGETVQRSCDGCDDGAPCSECASEKEDEERAVQRKSEGKAVRTSAGVPETLLDDMGSGSTLDPITKNLMESRFGYDFSQVRVHTDLRAVESAESVAALAYTVGRDVVFGEGQYDVASSQGKKLLAHELAHVVQQGACTGAAERPRVAGQPGDALERDATRDADAGSQPSRILATAPILIQRQKLDDDEPPSGDDCGTPVDMVKNTKERFKGGKTMEDYYGHPANGEWAHGGTAGPFVTSQYAGSNVQLIGTVRSPCDPSKFHLTQTVTFTKDRRNGARYSGSQEGQSGPDAPVPFRQIWLGNPPGLNISSADGPAVDYKTNVGSGLELDREFTTSLVGPSDKKSVDWKTSIVVKDGKVTTNTIS